MALIDVSELLTDPDFINTFTVISRTSEVDDYGVNQLSETSRSAVGSVQAGNGETLERLPEGALLSDAITVYTQEALVAQAPGVYGDVVVWNGVRYQVKVLSPWQNYGTGFTRADCLIERVSL